MKDSFIGGEAENETTKTVIGNVFQNSDAGWKQKVDALVLIKKSTAGRANGERVLDEVGKARVSRIQIRRVDEMLEKRVLEKDERKLSKK